jgi:hypothetical protein
MRRARFLTIGLATAALAEKDPCTTQTFSLAQTTAKSGPARADFSGSFLNG